MRMINITTVIVSAVLFALTSSVLVAEDNPPWQQPGAWPDRIITTLVGDPGTSFGVNWRTDQTITSTLAEIALATPAARFDLNSSSLTAMTETFTLDINIEEMRREDEAYLLNVKPVSYHSVTFTQLKPDTLYAFRVQGAPGKWSPWRQVRTAARSGPMEFLFFGDAQVGIRSHTTRLFDAARQASPFAKFMLHAGDLVDKGYNDRLWAEWFGALGDMASQVPSIPVPGNHDYMKRIQYNKKRVGQADLTPYWRPQFNLPVETDLPDSLHEAAYETAYSKDLNLWAIDSTAVEFDAQMFWLSRRLEKSSAKWRVIYMHHPYASWVGEGLEDPEQTRRRKLFAEMLERHDIDLVLTGHRHSYQRAESGAGVHGRDKTKPYPVDTVHIVTASISKRGTTKVEGWEKWAQEQHGNFTLTRWGDYVPLFGLIRIEGDRLSFWAVDSLGGVYDEFILLKDADNKKTIHNGKASFGPVWDIKSAGPYE